MLLFLGCGTKNDFLLIGAETITPKGSMNPANCGKLQCLVSKIMNNKQVLFYGLLESTNWLRSIFVGHISLLHDQAQEKEIMFLLIIFIDKNHFKKGKYGTT